MLLDARRHKHTENNDAKEVPEKKTVLYLYLNTYMNKTELDLTSISKNSLKIQMHQKYFNA